MFDNDRDGVFGALIKSANVMPLSVDTCHLYITGKTCADVSSVLFIC